ncbi:MAG: Activator of 2-hydroxyglutaryl-CoA dehydratase [Firmicutes bacterium]|nr:Activator of 2-hydroxyglutaryl-CoA dehydratase [Bacillota bacterium]MDI6705064.1 acyl-CoA dehydratase activase [Bacillota bacterium]
MRAYLGVDVGSVSTKLVVIDDAMNILSSIYTSTAGQPIRTVQDGLKAVEGEIGNKAEISGVGVTGSGREIASIIVGADVVKNEITSHAVAASYLVPDTRTILEIGGQDSKIIIMRNGIVVDFAMNTVCAAGTGSFLDHQAQRLGIPIEEFGGLALKADNPVRIAGRCSVFAESDMIHKQQLGHSTENIIAGLCEALVRNYLNNVGKGKEIKSKIVFQGGVAANIGIKAAFEQALDQEIIVPEHYKIMGAIGVALLARDHFKKHEKTRFKGFAASGFAYQPKSFECKSCSNLCEIIQIYQDGSLAARWGGRCGKWDTL